MESSRSLPFDSFKSKKILHSSSTKSSKPDETTEVNPCRSLWSSKTPEKPANPPRRARNCQAALSVKEVREAAAKLRVLGQGPRTKPNPVGSAGEQIGSGSGDAPIGKPKKKVDGSIKLPEKYDILGKFFDSLDSSVRLLRLKGSMSTFTNISPKIEYLTDRRFSHSHLAQLKFILPEVIELKKILVHDERTSCMKPDLHVTMNVDAIKNEGNSNARKVFRSRLLNFFKAHPEEEVPEGTLPEPFNQSKLDWHASTTRASSSSSPGEALTDALVEQQPAAATHLSRSFRKRFSRDVTNYEAVPSNQEQSMVSLKPSDQSFYEDQTSASSAASSITKLSLKQATRQTCSSIGPSQASAPPSHSPATPMKERDSMEKEVSSAVGTTTIQGTPAKIALTPVKLMSATPALQPPKRCFMGPLSPDDDSMNSPNKLVRRPLHSRSLKFDSPMKNAKVEDEVDNVGGLSVGNDILEILPENLLQSIREKERKALEEKDPAISQAKRRQKMIASVPKLFDMIRYLFQSIKRSVITKEEFMHKIMANHPDIVDKREVEEQLKLLQELAPGWIYEKLASGGEILICVNKISSPESTRARLVAAK
ncbi:CDT1-like protein [Actinidia chinensis var. chinensis]|uniref:CDT1-like protein n=1 Tax=Actinidia chinensis var. chinensis TaxID=1590841 RepID=A0A2R6QJ48_ACTCC|nr:CDT1-like protein [Actinidia chinensis var. chinensis]